MVSDVVYVRIDSLLLYHIKNTNSYKLAYEGRTIESFDIPEVGLRWPINGEYEELILDKHQPSGSEFVMLVIDKKKWLLTKIKYGG